MARIERDISTMLERSRRFWSRAETDRPQVNFWIGSIHPFHEHRHFAASLSEGEVRAEAVDIPAALADYERLYALHDSVGDDFLYVGMPCHGIQWFEAIIGCPTVVDVASGSAWTEPYIDDWSKVDWDRLERLAEHPEESPWTRLLIEWTEAIRRQGEGRYLAGQMNVRGPSDMIAAARDATNTVYDLFDHPQEVARFAAIATRISIRAAQLQREACSRFEGGMAMGMWRVWAPGEAMSYQEDASAFFSPEFFNEHLLPGDIALARSVPYSVIHIHSTAIYPVNDLSRVDAITCIEINVDRSGPPVEKLIPAFREVQQRKPLILRGEFDEEELRMLLDELDFRGLSLNVVTDDLEQAQARFAFIREYASRAARPQM